ncbi:RHS repeat-associated core domain-containing protein [Gilvimarinus sp. 2_MG-2023]|uniref:RHS repeat domain-containing protein n=1 Tax=Gilvimarinus sp. 2_MG-2023 TaxID=3062666 RepID=UPI0026E47410|nr:RHS repeat-associated core domain-containing protein [Gilvimarinus sp. 2_MG-2023]MDO6570130.1 RHS repeat-associated core domain-containing protein [Gilvimarinus sp. 2_MG-2023]
MSNLWVSWIFHHNDHLGTPKALTNASGTVVWQADYTPFGELTETVSIVEQPFRFPGQYYDGEAGLHYNYFRDYDPGLGRYVQSDPIGLRGGINTFGYGYQNPLKFTDSYGLNVESCDHAWRPASANTGYGLFGTVCGPAGDPRAASHIPDGPYSYACRKHDECYSTCGKSKLSCDLQLWALTGGSAIYFWAVAISETASQAYSKAQEDCDDCEEN